MKVSFYCSYPCFPVCLCVLGFVALVTCGLVVRGAMALLELHVVTS